ncbi:MAG: PilZ domain-containing protein [Nitrospirota bacterium]
MEGRTDRRRRPRFIKRLTAKCRVDHHVFTGISSDLSEDGVFIRTSRGFAPDTVVAIEIVMPDNSIALLRGIVARTVKTPFPSVGNGMGIMLLEKDGRYINFVKSLGALFQDLQPL